MVYFQLEIVCCQDGIGHSDRHQQHHHRPARIALYLFLHCNCQDEVSHLLLNSSHLLIQLKAKDTCQSSSISKHKIEVKVQKYWSTEKEFWAHLLTCYIYMVVLTIIRSGGDSVWQLSISNAAMVEWWSGGMVEWCRHEPEQETTFPQPPECKLYTRQKSAERKLLFFAPP